MAIYQKSTTPQIIKTITENKISNFFNVVSSFLFALQDLKKNKIPPQLERDYLSYSNYSDNLKAPNNSADFAAFFGLIIPHL